MINPAVHTFHIPVLGLGFSIDSPLKVAQYGISSVISLGDDALIEQMRAHYSNMYKKPYQAITPEQPDYRAKRITAYLDLVDDLVAQQIEEVRQEEFMPGSKITKYYELLPDNSHLKQDYLLMLVESDTVQKYLLQQEVRRAIVPGNIDVNILTRLDNTNYSPSGEELPQEFSDALAALRGFAKSKVHSSIVLSAGLNMRLFNYMENFFCFYPNSDGRFKKRIIVKVSDYRSAIVQGKMLAKKGLFVSEFRIESGLNCGGYTFATDGFLLGPIMEEFRQNQSTLRQELYSLFCSSLASRGLHVPYNLPELRLTVQGGIGTAEEHSFLLQYYGMDSAGWGTPFLLVPEATTVDDETLQRLTVAGKEDLYLNPDSPLGIPYNTLRTSSANTGSSTPAASQEADKRSTLIFPGPNLAYFSEVYTLQQMVDHIYGRYNVLNTTYRPHIFISELYMYISFWKGLKAEQLDPLTEKQNKYLQYFWQNLQEGISYYKQLLPSLFPDNPDQQIQLLDELQVAQNELFSVALETASV